MVLLSCYQAQGLNGCRMRFVKVRPPMQYCLQSFARTQLDKACLSV